MNNYEKQYIKFIEKIKLSTDTKILSEINTIKDDELRLYILSKIYKYISPLKVLSIIMTSKFSESRKIKEFQKYVNFFDPIQFFSMYNMISDLNNKYNFLKNYIKYFFNEKISYIDIFLNDYYSLIDPMSLSKYLKEFAPIERNQLIEHLFRICKNRKEKLLIANAVAFCDKEYFLDNILNRLITFNDKELEMINLLERNNSYLFNTFHFGLLNIAELLDNVDFLIKLSKYPEIAHLVVKIYNRNKTHFKILKSLIDYVYNFDYNPDRIVEYLVIELSKERYNHLLDMIDRNSFDDNLKKNFILKLYTTSNINGIYSNCTIETSINDIEDLKMYKVLINQKCDNIIATSKNLREIKNAILNKLFGVNIIEANLILDTFKIDCNYKSSPTFKYLEDIKTIYNSDDISMLKNYFTSQKPIETEQIIFFSELIIKEFSNILNKNIYKIKDKIPNLYYEYKGIKIPVYIPKGDFYLLANSYSSYLSKPLIEGDYYSALYNNNKTKSHVICCFLATNQNIKSTPPRKDIVFGFSNIESKALLSMDSNDLKTSTEIYSTNSSISSANHFREIHRIIDHVNVFGARYSEIDLERRIINKHYYHIRPYDYVIIYSDDCSTIKEKSIKAAYELKIPIVYIDVNIVIEREKKVIDNLSDFASETLDLSVFESMMTRIANNSLTYNVFGFEKIRKYIIKFLDSTLIAFKQEIIDYKTTSEILKSIKEILETQLERIVLYSGFTMCCLNIIKSYMKKLEMFNVEMIKEKGFEIRPLKKDN